MGINRQTPKPIIHGPTSLGGMGFKHIVSEQGALHASLLLYHLRLPKTEPCNQLSRIMLSHLAVESGLSSPPLSRNVPMHQLSNYLQESFLKTTWAYLHKIDAEITSPYIPTIRLQRSQDIFLMDTITSLNLSTKDIRRIQRCRLFLHALRLSDITTLDGTRIATECLFGHRITARQSTWTFPKQKRPPKRDMVFFWQTLQKAKVIDSKGLLSTPLGHWTHRDFSTTYFHSFKHQKLFKVQLTSTNDCTVSLFDQMSLKYNGKQSLRFFNCTPQREPTFLPKDATPIDISFFGRLL